MPENIYSFKKEFSEIIKDFKKEVFKNKEEYQQVSKHNKNGWLEVKMLIMALLRITPQKGSPPYAESLFDSYADRFEQSLLENLLYKSPNVICEMLCEIDSNASFETAIDLGCGTGLMGDTLKKQFNIRKLIGVDISANMLEIARTKNIYNDLIVNDLNSFVFKADTNKANLITMTDVLVYIGDVTELFYHISKILNQGGLFGFDFELLEKKYGRKDFYLRKSARYAYNSDYMVKKLKDFNFLPILNKEEVIRYEYGKPVVGGFFIAEKR